ncbi:MAG: RNA polymerase sigma factor [candidate division Zixibacteria bacterium]|nr:RNA polymerase sigma factor [candidate division Zixibacteria bacterium]MDH3937744.1 RNA polymerase sigma factor [candidate division Zixibacteria bacterium]MDH4033084.1 RNA polymerase sigma factor [candidate division Zixibacteria bacterium]
MNPARETDSQSFTQLFHEHKNHIYDFVLKMLGDKDTAADIVQDVFIRLHEHLNKKRPIDDVRNWLFIVARNLCLNHLRRHRKQQPLDSVIDNIEHSYSTADSRLTALRQAVGRLESPYREGLILKVYQGFAYTEIADILGTTVPAVRAILFKARNQLRNALNRTQAKGDSYEL